MSKYVEKNLQRDEHVILKARFNPLAAIWQLIWAIICIAGNILLHQALDTIMTAIVGSELNFTQMQTDRPEIMDNISLWSNVILLVIGILPLALRLINLLIFTEIAVTDKRVVGKTGIISMRSTDLHIDKVDNVVISTTFWGRIFHFYTVSIKGSGDGEGIPYKGVINANELKNAVNDAIEKHAEQARKAQAAEIAMAMNRGNA